MSIANNKSAVLVEAEAQIKLLVQQADDIVKIDAVRIADKHGISFTVGEYGSSNTYWPKGTNAEENYIENACRYNGCSLDDDGNLLSGEWISSSDMC